MTVIMLKCDNFDFYFNGCRCCGIFNLIILPLNFYYLSNQYTLSHTCQTHFLKMSTHYLYLKISHTSLFLLDCLSIFFTTLILVVVQYRKKNQILSLVFFLCVIYFTVFTIVVVVLSLMESFGLILPFSILISILGTI